VLHVANNDEDVKFARWAFASMVFVFRFMGFLLLFLAYGAFTPAGPGFNAGSLAKFRLTMLSMTKESVSRIKSKGDWMEWMGDNVLLSSPDDNLFLASGRQLRFDVHEPGITMDQAPASQAEHESMPSPPENSRRSVFRMGTFERGLIGMPLGTEASTIELYKSSNSSFMMFAESPLVGALRVRQFLHPLQVCETPDFLWHSSTICPEQDIVYGSASYDIQSMDQLIIPYDEYLSDPNEGDIILDLNTGNETQRTQIVAMKGNASQPWTSAETKSLIVDFTVYNPGLQAFASTRFMTYFPTHGSATTAVEVHVFRPRYGRFPPSIPFIVATCIMLLVEAILFARSGVIREACVAFDTAQSRPRW
jgi:hypothetical protein